MNRALKRKLKLEIARSDKLRECIHLGDSKIDSFFYIFRKYNI